MIFGDELRALAAAHPSFRLHEQHTRTAGRLTLAALDALVPGLARARGLRLRPRPPCWTAAEAHWAAAGIADRLHVERFRAAGCCPTPAARAARSPSPAPARTVDADGATALLDAGEAAGALLPSGCRMGICHGCVLPLLDGQVRDLRTGEVHGEPGDLVQTCICAACGPVLLDA